jgi:hypothetical protein
MIKLLKSGKQPEERATTLPMAGVGLGLVFATLLTFSVICAGVVQASDIAGVYHVTTTCNESSDAASPWQMAEMVCCHCYSPKSDGTRFYHGVLEAGFCRSQRGYCEGFAKCFP